MMPAPVLDPATGTPLLRQRLYGWRLWSLLATAIAIQIVFSGFGLRTPWARPLARTLARAALGLAGIPISVRGLHWLPAGPHMLLLNHSSFTDPIMLTALLPPRPGYAFVARRQYRSQFLLWPLLHSVGTLVLAHPAGSYNVNVEAIRKHLAAGERLVVFPEGRIPHEAGLQEFHTGVFAAALGAGVPVVPAFLGGTRALLPPGSWLPRRAEVTLWIGKPISSDAFQSRNPYLLEAAARLRQTAYEAVLRMGPSQHCAPPHPRNR